MKKIYLDYNASTPISQRVLDAMKPYLEGFIGNPSSTHWAGTPFKMALNDARKKVAHSIGASESQVIFTSGGSEANNHAIKGIFFANMHKGKHIITSSIEHPAVTNPCEYLKKFGAEVSYLPVDSKGFVNPDDLRKEIKSDTILVSIMHANNEIGSIQPIQELSKIAHENGVYFHTDAAQTFGKISVNVKELGVDLLTIAGHKFHAPKGVGALYIKAGTTIDSFVHGAGHENGRRAGTENILFNVALGEACANVEEIISQMNSSINDLRDYLWASLKSEFGDSVVLNGSFQNSLPNTLSIGFLNRSGTQILSSIPELAASTGSACHSGQESLSSTLKAMGVPTYIGLGTIRFSLGVETTKNDIDETLHLLKNSVAHSLIS